MPRTRLVQTTWFSCVLILTTCDVTYSSFSSSRNSQTKPHIILIVADDLGWNDVSWHSPQAQSPNLEELAKGGVLLNQSYVQPICTPTRSALLTGSYPFTLGRQHGVLKPEEPTGLSIKRKLLPEALKDAGYSTHAVGKWHLGFCSWDYTPTSRGFNTFWGYYTGAEDYYHHTRGSLCLDDQLLPEDSNEHQINGSAKRFGYDFRNNTQTEYSVDGVYSSFSFASYIEDLLESRNPKDPMFLYLPFQSVHAPLQVPKNYTKPFDHIKHHDRRIKLGMILAMDEAIGRVVDALQSSGHYNNSVIVFTTDNGGPTVSAGNNWPLRGNKSTLWEGGTRGVAFVHSPLLPQKGIVSNKLIHVTDWFSTLAHLGGGVAPADTDGYDQWEAITTSARSPRKEMIYNIDVEHQMNAGIRMGDFKLLVGDPGAGDWTPPPEGNQGKTYQDINVMREREMDSAITAWTSAPLLNAFEVGETPEFSETQFSTRKTILLSKYRNGGPFVFMTDVASASSDLVERIPLDNIQKRIFGSMESTTEKYEDTTERSTVNDYIKSIEEIISENSQGETNTYPRYTATQTNSLTIQEEVTEMQKGVTGIQEEVTEMEMHNDFNEMQKEVTRMQKGITGMHTEVTRMDKYLTGMEEEATEMQKEVTMNSFIIGDTTTIYKDHIKTTKGQRDFVTVEDLNIDLNQYKYLEELLRNHTALRLYNITDDPEEQIDLAAHQKDVVKILLGFLQHHMKDYVNPDIFPNDPNGNPTHWNNTWTPGWCTAK